MKISVEGRKLKASSWRRIKWILNMVSQNCFQKAACFSRKGILFREQSLKGRYWFHNLLQYPNFFCCMNQIAKSLEFYSRHKGGVSTWNKYIATHYLVPCIKPFSGIKRVFKIFDTWALNFPSPKVGVLAVEYPAVCINQAAACRKLLCCLLLWDLVIIVNGKISRPATCLVLWCCYFDFGVRNCFVYVNDVIEVCEDCVMNVDFSDKF